MYLATVERSAPKRSPAPENGVALIGLSRAMNPALSGLRGLGELRPGDPSTFLMSAGLAGTGIALGVGAMGTIFFIGTALEARSKLVKISGYTLAGLSGAGLILGILGLVAGLMEKRAKDEAKAKAAATPKESVEV